MPPDGKSSQVSTDYLLRKLLACCRLSIDVKSVQCIRDGAGDCIIQVFYARVVILFSRPDQPGPGSRRLPGDCLVRVLQFDARRPPLCLAVFWGATPLIDLPQRLLLLPGLDKGADAAHNPFSIPGRKYARRC